MRPMPKVDILAFRPNMTLEYTHNYSYFVKFVNNKEKWCYIMLDKS